MTTHNGSPPPPPPPSSNPTVGKVKFYFFHSSATLSQNKVSSPSPFEKDLI